MIQGLNTLKNVPYFSSIGKLKYKSYKSLPTCITLMVLYILVVPGVRNNFLSFLSYKFVH